jgi:hypothetical protein
MSRRDDLFDGKTYEAERDEPRLVIQIQEIWDIMSDGRWHTLPELRRRTGHPEASISARIRDFRKQRWGAHIVERDYIANGLWRYRMIDQQGDHES